jgi:hypothetical protein
MYSKMFGFSKNTLNKYKSSFNFKNVFNKTKFNNFCVISNKKPDLKVYIKIIISKSNRIVKQQGNIPYLIMNMML